jgi:hypothetical protein
MLNTEGNNSDKFIQREKLKSGKITNNNDAEYMTN